MLLQLPCDWGDKVSTAEDDSRCARRAVGVVAVRDGPKRILALNVCTNHRLVLMSETDSV